MSDKFQEFMKNVAKCNLCHGPDGITVPPLDIPKGRVRMVLLGEQPNRNEKTRRGRRTFGLWDDPELELLRSYLARTGVPRDEILYATAVLCLPRVRTRRRNRPSTDEARNCGSHVRILLETARPQLVVTLGHTPLLTLQHTYQKWTELRQYILNYDVGTVLAGPDFSVYPLYFPSESTLKARGERRQLQDWKKIPEILGSQAAV